MAGNSLGFALPAPRGLSIAHAYRRARMMPVASDVLPTPELVPATTTTGVGRGVSAIVSSPRAPRVRSRAQLGGLSLQQHPVAHWLCLCVLEVREPPLYVMWVATAMRFDAAYDT